MSSKAPAFLVHGLPAEIQPLQNEFGLEPCELRGQALAGLLADATAGLVLVDAWSAAETDAFSKAIGTLSRRVNLVVVGRALTLEQVHRLLIGSRLLACPSSVTEGEARALIVRLLEMSRLDEQNRRLNEALVEQNAILLRLTQDLESRVEQRHAELESKKQELDQAAQRATLVHRSLLAVYHSRSLNEIQDRVAQVLRAPMQMERIFIRYRGQASDTGQRPLAPNLHVTQLIRQDLVFGHVLFQRSTGEFTRDERRALDQLAQAMNLALRRLEKLREAETRKASWDATFDAILEPVSVITSDHRIVRANREFLRSVNRAADLVIGQRCHEVLFGKPTPCAGCELGRGFRRQPTEGAQPTVYQVSSQQVSHWVEDDWFERENQTYFLQMYRDITADLERERRLIDSARLAELGTISSSIAHEINNPLGAILSFIQLIRMDIKEDSPDLIELAQDLRDMEADVRRCAEIVKSLLRFARRDRNDVAERIEIRDCVDQAVKIVSLQTRAIGGEIRVQQAEPVWSVGSGPALTQAFCSLLQQSLEALRRHPEGSEPRAQPPVVDVQIGRSKTGHPEIRIRDQGEHLESSTTLTSANLQSLTSLGVRVEILAETPRGRQVILALPDPTSLEEQGETESQVSST